MSYLKMSESTDLFGTEESESQPSFQREPSKSQTFIQTEDDTNTPLFESESFFGHQIDKLVQIKHRMTLLYKDLGQGQITENLTPSRRNEIIEDLQQERQKLQTVLNETFEPIDKDVRRASALQLIVTTSTDGFDRLLNKDFDSEALSAEDVQFQRRE